MSLRNRTDPFPALLFFLALLISSGITWLQNTPGYMDAEYYYASSIRLFQGNGFSEMFLWNYLDNPQGLPHPSHLYWMPLPAMISWLGMIVCGNMNYFSARIGFFTLWSLVPVVTYFMGLQLLGEKRQARAAGIFSLMPVFYSPFITLTETFTPYMLLGGCYFLGIAILTRVTQRRKLLAGFAVLGLIAGLMHMTRADGLLYLGITWLAAVMFFWKKDRNKLLIAVLIVSFLGYVVVMGAWYWRNILMFGNLFPAGNSRAIFLTGYNQLFSYPPETITYENWLKSGWDRILSDRAGAAWGNLKTLLAVQAEIFLFPLVLVGFWALRKTVHSQLAAFSLVLLFLVMSIIFPYAGVRGGFLHSAAALQPWFWTLAAKGLDSFVEWGRRNRGWHPVTAWKVYLGGFIFLGAALTGFMIYSRVIGPDFSHRLWDQPYQRVVEVDQYLKNVLGADPSGVVMVNNPPGYFIANQRPSIVIPDGDIQSTMAAATKYHARYLLLDENYPAGLKEIYQDAPIRSEVRYLATIDGVKIFDLGSR